MIVLIADDLTGASDAAVQFSRRGLATRVVFDVVDAAGVDVLAVDTDTRALPALEAYARVRGMADRLRAAQPALVYKKIDSTLRGQLGAEIDAVMDAFDFRVAVVAPAFPRLGRTTRGAVHHLHGTPVQHTEVGRDPKTPVHESNLVHLLAGGSRRRAALVGLPCVALGPQAVRAQVDEHIRAGARLIVCDAESDGHLRAIADTFIGRHDMLWVGSAGLAEHVADALGLGGREPPAGGPERSGRPVLLVAGTASGTTRRQVAAVAARPRVRLVELDPRALARGRSACTAELTRCQALLSAALASGFDCALVVGAGPVGQLSDDLATRIGDALGFLGAECVRTSDLGGLILTGGDTARAVCRHLGVAGVDVLAEVEPGLPLGRLVGGPRLLVVTKAGAFGTVQSLSHALDHLKGDV